MANALDIDNYPEFAATWEKVSPFTMTSPERGFALWNAVRGVVQTGIPGAFVECGVGKGGSAMIIALTLLQCGVRDREIFLFDTFDGMTAPSSQDVDLHGDHTVALMSGSRGPEVTKLVKAAAGIDEVRAAMASTGYDMRLVRLVKGDVVQTLPRTQTLRICLLRLDTDFYDRTLAGLRCLYPRLAGGGPLIIDDYGQWQGCRQAVDDYFADLRTGFVKPLLWAIDYTGVAGVKVEAEGEVEIARYDYVPPNMHAPDLSPLFPYARPENPWAVNWPYLRKEVPHVWRSDSRNDTPWVTGNASSEEAACLYSLASLFRGQRGLEIGTHFGWTGAHLLAAGLRLDCIDPEFASPVREAAIREVFDAISGREVYRLWAGYSPGLVSQARAAEEEPWSFVFIDGNHDGDAPRDDACEVLKYLADDAIVVFHDLTSPFVERGLAVYKNAGFSVKLFNTMQILGVAWRGSVHPPEHIQDPNVPVIFHEHLAKYLVQSSNRDARRKGQT
jgi:predicted O-methyltransferase YrrM